MTFWRKEQDRDARERRLLTIEKQSHEGKKTKNKSRSSFTVEVLANKLFTCTRDLHFQYSSEKRDTRRDADKAEEVRTTG